MIFAKICVILSVVGISGGLRCGVYEAADFRQVPRRGKTMKKILFVCTGNTCRSPMAEAIFNAMAKSEGIDAKAYSAGLYADGAPTSHGAVEALREVGIEHSAPSHRLMPDDLIYMDRVYGMTANHAASLKSALPQYAAKIGAFPLEVPDPFGGDLEVYRKCRDRIKEGVAKLLEEIKAGKI